MPPIEVLLLRHAHTESISRDVEDHERRLVARGKSDCRVIGEYLAREGLLPDVVLTSSALRTKMTSALVLEAAQHVVPVRVDTSIYRATPPMIERVIHTHAASFDADGIRRLLVVAHNPGIEVMHAMLTGSMHVFTPGTLARLQFSDIVWTDFSLTTQVADRSISAPSDLSS